MKKLNLTEQITIACANKFRSWGGGKTSDYNPIVNALSGGPLEFAAGVDIKDVVSFVLAEKAKAARRAKKVK